MKYIDYINYIFNDPSNPVTITLNVTFQIDLPLVTFYSNNITCNNIPYKRYTLLDKYSLYHLSYSFVVINLGILVALFFVIKKIS